MNICNKNNNINKLLIYYWLKVVKLIVFLDVLGFCLGIRGDFSVEVIKENEYFICKIDDFIIDNYSLLY